MGTPLNKLVAQGIVTDPTGCGAWTTKVFESGQRRARCGMCDGCKHGMHCLCESEACPCVCNDSDFRWSRKSKPKSEISRLTSDDELAHVLAVRPELRPLFGMSGSR